EFRHIRKAGVVDYDKVVLTEHLKAARVETADSQTGQRHRLQECVRNVGADDQLLESRFLPAQAPLLLAGLLRRKPEWFDVDGTAPGSRGKPQPDSQRRQEQIARSP